MRERSIFLGSDSRMTGIITSPDDAQPGAGLPAILLLNAGLIHHVGPNRMYVDLARRLANHGFTSIRFDMTGIGDSDRADMELPYVEQTVADIREAMDGLEEELGVQDFVLMGRAPALTVHWLQPRRTRGSQGLP